MSATESIRNPYRWPIQSVALQEALGELNTGGVYIQPGEIITGVPYEYAVKAASTGVLQRTENGEWLFDGKVNLEGKRAQ